MSVSPIVTGGYGFGIPFVVTGGYIAPIALTLTVGVGASFVPTEAASMSIALSLGSADAFVPTQNSVMPVGLTLGSTDAFTPSVTAASSVSISFGSAEDFTPTLTNTVAESLTVGVGASVLNTAVNLDGPYRYITFAQAKNQLAQRLDNPDKQFWTDTELGLYIEQALSIWNSLTSYWRVEFTFPTVSGTVWYDITDPAVAPDTTRPMTVTDVDLLTIMEYMLLEPPTGATWTGSLQFSVDDLLKAVQRRRDEILSNTSCTVNRHLTTASLTNTRTVLDDKTIDVRRVAWLPNTPTATYKNTPLLPDDQFALQAYGSIYTARTSGTPGEYLQSAEPPISFDVDTLPAVAGQYEVLSVDAGADLTVLTPTVLNIPNDFAWVNLFGAMGDLFNRDGNAKDLLRAQYCNARYIHGNALLSRSPAVLYTLINGAPIELDSAQNVDNYRPRWQSTTATQPDTAIIAGLNLMGFAVTPDAIYTVTVMTVRNTPLPSADGNYLQVGRDDLDVMLDYAQHIATLKMGGAEFMATMPLLQRFFAQALLYNSKLDELGEYSKFMREISRLQEVFNPVFDKSMDATKLNPDINNNTGDNT